MLDFELHQSRTGASFLHQCNAQKGTTYGQIAALCSGRHPNKSLQIAYNADPRGWLIKAVETPENRERLWQIGAKADLLVKRNS